MIELILNEPILKAVISIAALPTTLISGTTGLILSVTDSVSIPYSSII